MGVVVAVTSRMDHVGKTDYRAVLNWPSYFVVAIQMIIALDVTSAISKAQFV